MTVRGRGISNIGQAFLGLTGGMRGTAGTRGRGIEQFGQTFPAAGGGEAVAPPEEFAAPLFRKWWYEKEYLKSRLGYEVMQRIIAMNELEEPMVGIPAEVQAVAWGE